MAPIPSTARKWATWDIAALWISMSACVTTYTLASSLIDGGMNWWQAVLTIFLANTIVLIPMVLNAPMPGTRYGIPFPVYCRASFGLRGAQPPRSSSALPSLPADGSASKPGSAAKPSTPSSPSCLYPATAQNSHILTTLRPLPPPPTPLSI